MLVFLLLCNHCTLQVLLGGIKKVSKKSSLKSPLSSQRDPPTVALPKPYPRGAESDETNSGDEVACPSSPLREGGGRAGGFAMSGGTEAMLRALEQREAELGAELGEELGAGSYVIFNRQAGEGGASPVS